MEAVFSLFNTLVIFPLVNILFAVYAVLNAISIPYAMGFSIIGLTIIVRLIFYPLTNKQLRASKKMQDIAPLVSEIKSKYKGDNKRVQEETMKLYKEKGVNPAAGCLPTLVQLPILLGLYRVLIELVNKAPEEAVAYINGIVFTPLQVTSYWDPTFFGIPLGQSPQQMLATLPLVAIGIPLLTGVFQFIQSKMMFSTPPSKAVTKKKDDKNNNPDFATTFQKQAAYIFPVMIGFFAFNFPFGLSLYWNTFTIFGIIQQYKISGLGGLEGIWLKIKPMIKK
jgi:YidC/Oxa1 family membrane protein insertase